jgi:hypothetical protein
VPPVHRHPSDVLVDDVVRLYADTHHRLEGIVAAGLRRGLDPSRIGTPAQARGDATLAYRQRQAAQARGLLDELERQSGQLAPLVVGRSYGAGLVAVDKVADLGDDTSAAFRGRFGRVHTRAVEALAANLNNSLTAATQRARANLNTVFELADALDGPLPASGEVAGVPFLGRRFNDAYRRVALETVAGGVIGLDTRRQTSAMLARKLVTEGVTTALAGFVDRSGRRWSLASYAAMVARTTTREAMTSATANRLEEHGLDLVTIPVHLHPADECTPYEGNVYSLSGRDPRYPVLPARPPFHPNCVHVLAPAGVNLDDFEAELERAASPKPSVTTPEPTAKLTPAERQAAKVRALIDDQRASVTAAAVDGALDAAIDRTALSAGQAERLKRLRRGDPIDYEAEGLSYAYESDLAHIKALETTDVVKAAREAVATGTVTLDEASTTLIGKEVLKLADKVGGRLKATERRLNAADKAIAEVKALHAAELKRVSDAQAAAFDRLVAASRAGDDKAERAASAECRELDKRLGDLWERERLELAGLEADRLGAIRERTAARRDDVLDALRLVRPNYGTKRLLAEIEGTPSARAAIKADLEEVSRLFPAEWQAASRADADAVKFLRIKALEGRRRGRGDDAHYSHITRYVQNRPGDRSVLAHELGHHFERVVSGVRELERAFYVRRTAKRGRHKPTPIGKPDALVGLTRDDLQPERKLSVVTGNTSYEDHELTREDKFTDAYIGKDYGDSAYEVLTMGLEGLFYGRHNIADDPDLLRFIVGILASA